MSGYNVMINEINRLKADCAEFKKALTKISCWQNTDINEVTEYAFDVLYKHLSNEDWGNE